MRFFKLLLLLMVLFASPVVGAHADDLPETLVKIRILPESNTVKPGDEIWIGVEQSIYPGWHTYWKNPGDSGSEPRIAWSLPEGFEISDIHWPTPHKIPYGPLLNYGYEDNVILLQKLTAPDDLPKGTLTLKADIEILVCEEICIPEFGEYEITLNAPGVPAEDNSKYLQDARIDVASKVDWDVGYSEQDGNFVLDFGDIEELGLGSLDLNTFEILPYQWGAIDNMAPPEARLDGTDLKIFQTRGDRDLTEIENLRAILAFEAPDGSRQSLEFTAKPTGAVSSTADKKTGSLQAIEQTSFLKAIILALFGGLILNLMPCVFPVLSIKALSLVKTAEKDPKQARIHGISYTAGVILSFLAIAGALIALKLGGASIGWGFQLQNPIVITLLAYLLFIIGLNLSGVFEIGGKLTNIGGTLTGGHGYGNSFFTGVLATLVATPCTAPFMGAAIGYALLQSNIVALSVFAALGFGLALPYLLLSFMPALQHILPKPGAWMDTFKQLLAFPMYGFAAWLIWILTQQAGSLATLGALLGLVAIAFGFWLLSHKPKNGNLRIVVIILALISFITSVWFLPSMNTPPQTAAQDISFGEVWTPESLQNALESNDPVFVEMTAAWCITCKVNHASSINIEKTRTLFADKNVRYLIGDWTNQDPAITKYLDSFGRNGVPIYVYYGTPNAKGMRPDPKVLPQILTPAIVAEFVNENAS